MLTREAISRLEFEHNDSHHAIDAKVVKVAPGHGRNTGESTRFAHCDDSDLIVTVKYTATIYRSADYGVCAKCDAISDEIVASVDDTGNGYDGPMHCGKHFTTYPSARAIYGYLDGKFILWMN